VFLVTAFGAVVAVGALLLSHHRFGKRLGEHRCSWLLAGGLALAALALPLRVSLGLVADHEYDSGYTGVIQAGEVTAISDYIRAHRDGAHYEFVAADPSTVGSLIVHDVQPILSLTSHG